MITTGTVESRDKERNGTGSKTYRVLYSFYTSAEVPISGQQIVSREKYKKSKPGQAIKVRYDRDNPSSNMIDLRRSLNVDKTFGVGLGLLFVVAGALFSSIWSRRFYNWKRTIGTVSRVTGIGENSARIFEFNVGNATYSNRASTNGNVGEIGSNVLVYYDPSNPKKADIHSTIHHVIFAMAFPLVGAGVAVVSYFSG